MFETETENYVDKELKPPVIKPIVEICQECIEIGYKKANEWHYVKDGVFPKEDCLVYYKDAMGNFSCSFVHPSHYIAGVESFFKVL